MPISDKTFDFLVENRMRDDRNWFLAHKDIYQSTVVQPLLEISAALAPCMKQMDAQLVTQPDRTLSRIYRDTRFSRDKSRYRDVMWIVFQRDKKAFPCPPGFFLELSPTRFRYGCGYWQCPSKTLEEVRKLILSGNKTAMAAVRAMKQQTVFSLEGEKYQRLRYKDQPEEIRDWLNRRNLCMICNSTDFPLLYSSSLCQTIEQDFQLLKPFYALLCLAQDHVNHTAGGSNR